MKIGTKFKQIRQDKHLTQADVAQGIISVSYLSKFEQNKVNISYNKLIQLIQRLNITIVEFEMFMNHDNLPSQADFYHDLHYAKQNQNLIKINTIRDKQEELYHQTHNQRFLFNTIIANQEINRLSDLNYHTEDIQKIIDYLYQVNHWYTYEINLFGNALFCFPYADVKFLTRTLIKHLSSQNNRIYRRNDAALHILNICLLCIEKNKLSDARHFLAQLDQFTDTSYDYFEQVRKLALLGILKIREGHTEAGKAQAQEALDMMIQLGDHTSADRYRNYLNKTLDSCSSQ
ncbi:helix-turn-helix domain-containing protein [Dolosigranulum pigrum]|uniref:helix-turn-helix domain-containing protein n=1 Tax=Dolosigranulum pigrum TaxID=29394 RepID=UPI001AD86473|nr:Rgg/GadR/MutR family transcriptional regulator [Dolosigranulum pigrum]QTJ56840.1 helix-turn-helix domain-containing protein [Dolosigranulum pigrum]